MPLWYVVEAFTPEERARLEPYFTNLEGPVFALTNLPEVVKGALFARYSRTTKSIRRLFLDEFAKDVEGFAVTGHVGTERAERLYDNVFFEYGDDSVAQLGGVHLACEQASQLLAKAIEWGRLAAYLEQSTRYMRYDDKPGGRWRLTVPPEIEGTPVGKDYQGFATRTFEAYGRMFQPTYDFFVERFPKDPADSDFIYRSTITAKTCDTLRVLLPTGTRSNLGVYADGQAFEMMLLRMRSHPLAEVREYADLMLVELRKLIPSFLKRVDLPDRGVAWSEYQAETRDAVASVAAKATAGVDEPTGGPEVTLTDWEPDGEEKIVAAALYASTDLPDRRLQDLAREMSPSERTEILRAYVGERGNRRHKPGRSFERTGYRFDVLCDYGAFRDLQRHRPLTLEWQVLTPQHGYATPEQIDEAGLADEWHRVMEDSATTWAKLADAAGKEVAQYAVAMAYRIRFVMQMSAREAIHLIELRSSPQGHPTYRRVAHQMHALIREMAGHTAIAEAMTYVDFSDVDLERLEAERRADAKRRATLEPRRP
ncbi:MAG TPA: FAD-dependent thymidylate synthase [Actinomycetota bacterium]|nr:FAD-dependent thymidylate synthase [Actinomycetota bacterium]